MHYKVTPGIIVKTENAAKSDKQQSSHLLSLLRSLSPVTSTFDYGCGKLRYASVILKTTEALAVVDSEIQLSRKQILHGTETSIRDISRRSNRVTAFNNVEFSKLSNSFDRAFCINVLSVIPIIARRREVLRTIWSRLRPHARCLFVVQYRNSDFDRMRRMPNARPWSDGFLIDSLRGYSFYGLISPTNLAAAVSRAGFSVEDIHLNDGSVYLWASRQK